MRLFEIYEVVKSGKKQTIKSSKLFSGSPSAAAKKAMTSLCKKYSGKCTLTVTMREVKRSMNNGVYKHIPVLDSDNMQIMRKYKMKRVDNDTSVVFEGDSLVDFKYKIEILESFGRVA
jgi:20S proteasome alpha/beta subunit